MAEQKIAIPRASDSTLIDVLGRLAKMHKPTNYNVHVLGLQHAFDPDNAEYSEVLASLKKRNSSLIHSAHIAWGGFRIAFKRGGPDRSGVFDELDISLDHNPPSPLDVGQRFKIVAALEDGLKFSNRAGRIGGAASEAQAQLEALHNSVLQTLEKAATDQIISNSEHLQKLESEYAGKRAALEQQLADRQIELDAALKERNAQVDARESALRQREADLDDRQNTHARRALHTRLQNQIAARQTSFTLTAGTKRLRWPIHLACVALLAIFGYLLYSFSGQTLEVIRSWKERPADQSSQIELVYLIGRNITLAAAFIGIAFFYLRWMNKWFEQHSEAEFLIKTMELDVDRASWVMEAALEWRSQVDEAMPESLMAGISRNLFHTSSKQVEDLQSPADHLASALIGSASTRIRLNTQLGDIDIDPTKLTKVKAHNNTDAR